MSIRFVSMGTLGLPCLRLRWAVRIRRRTADRFRLADADPAGRCPSAQSRARRAACGTTHFLSATTEDGRTDWNLPLQEGLCYTFSGIGGQGVKTQLYLYLWDQAEKRVATESPSGPKSPCATAQTCRAAITYKPRLAKALDRWPSVSMPSPRRRKPRHPRPWPRRRLTWAPSSTSKPPPPPPGAVRVGDFYRSVAGGETTAATGSPPLEPGRCCWFIGAGAPTVKELYLYLWNPQLQRVSDNRASSNRTMMGHCPTVPGMYKIEAKVNSGKGDYQLASTSSNPPFPSQSQAEGEPDPHQNGEVYCG